MEATLEAGADDIFANDDGSVELVCAPADFQRVRDALERAGLKAELAEITMKPTGETALAAGEQARLQRLVDALENLDDVQNVYSTAVLD